MQNSLKRFGPFVILAIIALGAAVVPAVTNFDGSGVYNSADTAWLIVAAALVFLMTPGLAFFYGGMVHRKNVISTMIKSIVAAGIVSILWVVVGFSLCFGDSINGIIGDPTTFLFFKNVASGAPWSLAPTIPLTLFAVFQLMFAIITPGLVVGAVAERIRFTAYVLFIALFSLLVYAPIAHWTWHPDGFLFKMGVLDFAGGTVVHISAGCAALAGAIVLKRRKVHIMREEVKPARIPYVLLGTGLLWFGWFGFNAGSAVGAGSLAVNAFANTNTASAAAGMAWIFFDMLRGRKPSALGFCIGAVVGLVAITPAAGYVSVPHSLAIGIISAVVSNLVVEWRTRTKIDDTLDVFPCHGVGGMVGMLLTGVFANQKVNVGNTTGDGLFFGHTHLFLVQLIALVGVSIFAFFGSLLLLKITDMISPLRVSAEDEEIGLDISQHGERL